MNAIEAKLIVDMGGSPSAPRVREAWQTLIDSGTVWGLGEWYAARASALIDAGVCKAKVIEVDLQQHGERS